MVVVHRDRLGVLQQKELKVDPNRSLHVKGDSQPSRVLLAPIDYDDLCFAIGRLGVGRLRPRMYQPSERWHLARVAWYELTRRPNFPVPDCHL